MDFYVLVLGSQSVYAARWAQVRTATIKMHDFVAGPGAGQIAANVLHAVRFYAGLFQRFQKGNLLYGLPRLHYASEDRQTPWSMRTNQCTSQVLCKHHVEYMIHTLLTPP